MNKGGVTMKYRTKLQLKRISIVVLLVIGIFALYRGLVIKKYIIRTVELDEGTQIRVVALADLHSHVHGTNQQDLVNKIKNLKPDLIVMVGDMIDDEAPITGMTLLLKGLQGVAPMYYVTGNHEYWSGHIDEIKAYMRSYHVTVLEQEYQSLEIKGSKVILAGMDDITGFEDENLWELEAKTAFRALEEMSGYKILLAHRPEQVAIYKELPFDLVIAGHTHGGIIRIPYLCNGFIAANQKIFPAYVGGLYEEEDLCLIVSRGLSAEVIPPRLFNPPEVTVIDLKGKG